MNLLFTNKYRNKLDAHLLIKENTETNKYDFYLVSGL